MRQNEREGTRTRSVWGKWPVESCLRSETVMTSVKNLIIELTAKLVNDSQHGFHMTVCILSSVSFLYHFKFCFYLYQRWTYILSHLQWYGTHILHDFSVPSHKLRYLFSRTPPSNFFVLSLSLSYINISASSFPFFSSLSLIFSSLIHDPFFMWLVPTITFLRLTDQRLTSSYIFLFFFSLNSSFSMFWLLFLQLKLVRS